MINKYGVDILTGRSLPVTLQGLPRGDSIRQVPHVLDEAARDSLNPTPTQGDKVFIESWGIEQTYYGLYNPSSNPIGAIRAGWYLSGGASFGTVRKLANPINLGPGTRALVAHSEDVDTFFPGLDWFAGQFIASRPMRLSIDLSVRFTYPTSSPTHTNTFLRRSTRQSFGGYTNSRIAGGAVASYSDFTGNISTEVCIDVDDALSVGAEMNGTGQVKSVSDNTNWCTYITIRELPIPPRKTTW